MDGSGQVALVTGSTSPIGLAIARDLLARSWRVVLQSADELALGELGQRLTGQGGDPNRNTSRLGTPVQGARVATFAADLSQDDDRDELVEYTLEQFERLDLLVSLVSGPHLFQDVLELRAEGLRPVLEAFLIDRLAVAQVAASEMIRLVEADVIESGKLVLVNSVAAHTAAGDRAAHCLASAATGMLTQLLAQRLAEQGVNVYEIRTGLIGTGEGGEAHARYERLIEQGLTPLRRWGRPEDVARAVAALADDALPYSTGQTICVDGGMHIRRL